MRGTAPVFSRTPTLSEEGTPVKGYCMKCREERMIADAREVRMKNGRPATEGKCPVCGTRMYRLGKSS